MPWELFMAQYKGTTRVRLKENKNKTKDRPQDHSAAHAFSSVYSVPLPTNRVSQAPRVFHAMLAVLVKASLEIELINRHLCFCEALMGASFSTPFLKSHTSCCK